MAIYKISNCEVVFKRGIEIECELFYQTSISGIAQNECELSTEDLRWWASEMDSALLSYNSTRNWLSQT